MNADRRFVDTNILVYAHDASAGDKHMVARELIANLWDSRTGCLSIQVLQEFFVTVTRKVARPLSAEVATQIITDLSHWSVHVPDTASILQGMEIHQRYNISFWDAMIIQSAAEMGCTVVLSEDLNTGQVYEGVQVVNPFTTRLKT